MTTTKRIKGIIDGLSPEDKARLVIEDLVRADPVLTRSERRDMIVAMSLVDRRRYTAFMDSFDTLRRNLVLLGSMCDEVLRLLLYRDRVLWFHAALMYVEEELTIHTEASRLLLVENPNLKPGKPIELTVPFAIILLGVSGRERRPVGSWSGVELNERTTRELEDLTDGIRRKASEVKATFNYIYDETREAGLDFIAGMAVEHVSNFALHDRSYSRLHCGKDDARDTEGHGKLSIGSVFPVPDRWALEWDATREDPDVARHIRDDSHDWVSSSYAGKSGEDLLEHLKEIAASEGAKCRDL